METLTATLKALSDQNRLRILVALMQHEELCACQLTELLEIAGATVSRHLGVLHTAGLVKNRKDGRWMYYSLGDNIAYSQPVLAWIKEKAADCERIQQDSAKLAEILRCDPEDICRKQRGKACCPTTK